MWNLHGILVPTGGVLWPGAVLRPWAIGAAALGAESQWNDLRSEPQISRSGPQPGRPCDSAGSKIETRKKLNRWHRCHLNIFEMKSCQMLPDGFKTHGVQTQSMIQLCWCSFCIWAISQVGLPLLHRLRSGHWKICPEGAQRVAAAATKRKMRHPVKWDTATDAFLQRSLPCDAADARWSWMLVVSCFCKTKYASMTPWPIGSYKVSIVDMELRSMIPSFLGNVLLKYQGWPIVASSGCRRR